jgi:hypothetical protein
MEQPTEPPPSSTPVVTSLRRSSSRRNAWIPVLVESAEQLPVSLLPKACGVALECDKGPAWVRRLLAAQQGEIGLAAAAKNPRKRKATSRSSRVAKKHKEKGTVTAQRHPRGVRAKRASGVKLTQSLLQEASPRVRETPRTTRKSSEGRTAHSLCCSSLKRAHCCSQSIASSCGTSPHPCRCRSAS